MTVSGGNMEKSLYVVRNVDNNYIYVVKAINTNTAEEIVENHTELKGITWIVELADNDKVLE